VGDELVPLTLAGVLAGATLIAMLVVAATGDLTGRPGAVLLAVLSVVWIFTNKPMEGSVIVTISDDHGATMADVVGLVAMALAVWRYLVSRQRRRRW